MKPFPTIAGEALNHGAIYYGCHGDKGHYAFAPGMVKLHLRELNILDAGFAPQNTWEQGCVWFHVGPDYSLLSFWDNSVDNRSNSHSTFLLPGKPMSYGRALALAQNYFPEVFARFNFSIVLATTWYRFPEKMDGKKEAEIYDGTLGRKVVEA